MNPIVPCENKRAMRKSW